MGYPDELGIFNQSRGNLGVCRWREIGAHRLDQARPFKVFILERKGGSSRWVPLILVIPILGLDIELDECEEEEETP